MLKKLLKCTLQHEKYIPNVFLHFIMSKVCYVYDICYDQSVLSVIF
jgi:hypothetical protein